MFSMQETLLMPCLEEQNVGNNPNITVEDWVENIVVHQYDGICSIVRSHEVKLKRP